jgi:hypothetical protein
MMLKRVKRKGILIGVRYWMTNKMRARGPTRAKKQRIEKRKVSLKEEDPRRIRYWSSPTVIHPTTEKYRRRRR